MAEAGSVILTYHSLDPSGSPISLHPDLFRRQMDVLARSGTRVVPLASVRQSPGSVALTFDDGYRNFFEHALPVLLEYRFPATVFVITGYCGLRNGWHSSRRPPAALDLMGWSELREVARLGMFLGAHTVHHPKLTEIPQPDIERELRECRQSLEDQIGQAIDSFAYPYGAWNHAARHAVSQQFLIGCGTELGFVDSRSDPFVLPRIDVKYRWQPWWFGRLTSTVSHLYLAAQRWKSGLRVSADERMRNFP